MLDREAIAEIAAALQARDATLTDEDAAAKAWVHAALPNPRTLAGWRLVGAPSIDGYHVVSGDRLSVICSGGVEADGKRWLHVSYARATRMPDYADTDRVRRLFIGTDRYCCAVWPPKDRYVSIHRYALHLWACLDDWPLPEFSGLMAGRRTI